MKASSVLLVFIVLLCPCSLHAADPENSVPIGAVLALTSDQAAPNHAFLEGIQLALDELEKDPSAPRFDLKVEDGRLLPKESFLGVKKLVEVDHVAALIAGSAVEAKAGAGVLNHAHVPTVTLWDSSPEIEALGDYIFSIGLWTPGSAEVAADFAASALGAKRAVLFISEDEWSQELEKAFRVRFTSLGRETAAVIRFNPGEIDFRSSILKARALNPDVAYVTIGYNIPAFFRQLKEAGWLTPVISSDILSDNLIRTDARLYEGVYQTQIDLPARPRTKQLLIRYEDKFDKPCEWLPWVAWGYDAVRMVAAAIAKGGLNGQRIAAELSSMKDFDGASAAISMRNGRSSRLQPVVFRVRSGAFIKADN